MASSTSHPVSDRPDTPKQILSLWIGILAGPLLFLMLLQVNYVFSYMACETQRTWFLHLATIVAPVLTAGAGTIAWRARRPLESDAAELSAPGVIHAPSTRAYWMAAAAALSCVWFIIAMLAMIVPAAILRPCQ
jgi:hypothetical protein